MKEREQMTTVYYDVGFHFGDPFFMHGVSLR